MLITIYAWPINYFYKIKLLIELYDLNTKIIYIKKKTSKPYKFYKSLF